MECHGKTWKRVVGIANDARGDYPHARMTMKKMVTNSHTKRSDFFYELFPVPLMSVLAVVQQGAERHSDLGSYTMDGLLNFFC